MSNKAQQRTTRHFRLPTSLLGKSLLVVAAVAIMALAAVVIVQGVGLAASSPNASSSYKATTLAGEANARATAQAQPQRTKPPFVVETPQPTATFTAGIIQTHQGPFSNEDFSVGNMYRGPAGSHWDVVFAGTDWTGAATGYHTGGKGALRIYNLSGSYEGIFLAPDDSTWVNIISVSGTTLTLQSDKTASFTFDLLTNTYGA